MEEVKEVQDVPEVKEVKEVMEVLAVIGDCKVGERVVAPKPEIAEEKEEEKIEGEAPTEEGSVTNDVMPHGYEV